MEQNYLLRPKFQLHIKEQKGANSILKFQQLKCHQYTLLEFYQLSVLFTNFAGFFGHVPQ